ncbi:MAG: hypothetical protein WC863_01060 [Patescibacteria group bacterium]
MFIGKLKNYYKSGRQLRGSALILTLFIMSGMMIIALGDAYVVLLGIKAAGLQAKSTKSYYMAEAGAERLLWELRKNAYSYTYPSLSTPIFTNTNSEIVPDYLGGTYQVYFTDFATSRVLTFKSIGSFQDANRSVEIKF